MVLNDDPVRSDREATRPNGESCGGSLTVASWMQALPVQPEPGMAAELPEPKGGPPDQAGWPGASARVRRRGHEHLASGHDAGRSTEAVQVALLALQYTLPLYGKVVGWYARDLGAAPHA